MSIFEYPETSLSSECNGTSCIEDINGECCRKSHDKLCCDIANELKYETSFRRKYPKCSTGPFSNRNGNSQGKMSCYSIIMKKKTIILCKPISNSLRCQV